jgi:hypothetical protein
VDATAMMIDALGAMGINQAVQAGIVKVKELKQDPRAAVGFAANIFEKAIIVDEVRIDVGSVSEDNRVIGKLGDRLGLANTGQLLRQFTAWPIVQFEVFDPDAAGRNRTQ